MGAYHCGELLPRFSFLPALNAEFFLDFLFLSFSSLYHHAHHHHPVLPFLHHEEPIVVNGFVGVGCWNSFVEALELMYIEGNGGVSDDVVGSWSWFQLGFWGVLKGNEAVKVVCVEAIGVWLDDGLSIWGLRDLGFVGKETTREEGTVEKATVVAVCAE
ncbi:hypothetical protein Droror1_Dr00018259, partial [Drosera rotundifolia]